MKRMNMHNRTMIWLTLLLMAFSACNKNDQPAEYAIQVLVNGYNGSANALKVTIDTTAYDPTISAGKFALKPASVFEFSAVYTYIPNQQQRMIVITDTVTKRTVFSQPLPANGTKALFNYLLLDGKVVEVPSPAPDPATNKLTFYIRYPESDAPVDIFLYRKDNATGVEQRTYLAKGAQPNNWITMNYTAGDAFGTKSSLNTTSICFTKAGTTDQWAFMDNESKSKLSPFGMGWPVAGEKGLVQAYFLTPGSIELAKARLFFYPDRL